MRRLFILMIIFVLFFALTNNVFGADPVTLRLSWAGSTTDIMYKAHELFAELVDYRSKGNIKVELSTGLGADVDLVEHVRTGVIDMTVCLKGEEYYPPLNLLLVPGIFKSPESMYNILSGPIGQEFNKGFIDAAGIRILDWWWQGERHVTSNKKVGPIRTPQDLNKVKMRVPGIQPWLTCFKETGAGIVSLPFGEIYLALRQGVIDAQENPIPAIIAMKFYEVQDYLSLTSHIYSYQAVYMNEKKYQSLPPEYKEILERSVKDAGAWLVTKTKEIEREGLNFLREEGMEIIEADKEAFRKVFKSAYKNISGAEEFSKRIEQYEN